MQREKGESIDNQKSRLLEYVKEKDCSHHIYEDAGFSAKDTNRPALKQLISDVKDNKVAVVLVTKVDRITRRIKDLLDLLELFEEHSVAFKSLTQPIDTSSAMGRGFLNLLGVFAEMEREMVSERVGEDMRHRAKNGKWNGGIVPYGYTTVEKQLQINAAEAEIVRQIYKKYLEIESLRGVTQWLNTNGYRTRNGKTWAAATISRVLSNPTYSGKVWYNKRVSSKTTGRLKRRPKDEWIIVDGNHPSIIDSETFNRVQKILERQSQEPRRKMSEYLLSGLVRCSKCGGAMNGYTQRRITPKSPRVYSYYKCHTCQSKGRSVCRGTTIPKKTLENIVIDRILSLANSKEFKIDIKKALERFNKEIQLRVKPLKQESTRLTARNERIEAKKKNLLVLLEDGIINKDTYKDRIAELNQEFEGNQRRVFEIEAKLNDNNVDTISFNSIYETTKNFRENWQYFDPLSKKDLLWSLISKVIVNDGEVKVELFFLPHIFSNFSNESLPLRILRFSGKGLPLLQLPDSEVSEQNLRAPVR